MWLSFENCRASRQWMPFRPCLKKGETEDACEDAERLILADDVKKYLFAVNGKPELFQLLCRCLELFQINVSKVFQPLNDDIYYEGINMFVSKKSDVNIFGRSCEDSWSSVEQKNKFVTNILQQGLFKFDGHMKTFLLLMLCDCLSEADKSKKQTKNVKKWLKSVLREEHNRDCLPLWEKYALLEWIDGNFEEARRIFDTALSMHAGQLSHTVLLSTNEKQSDIVCASCRTYKTYVELELGLYLFTNEHQEKQQQKERDTASEQKTLSILLHMFPAFQCSDKASSATIILRQRKMLEQLLDYHLNSLTSKESCELPIEELCQLATYGHVVCHLTRCLACLMYLTSDIHAASKVYNETIEKLAASVCNEEINKLSPVNLKYRLHHELVRSHVCLLQFHIMSSISPLSTLRTVLANALHQYSDDSLLLNMYIDLEGQTVVANRMRRFFHQLVQNSISVVPWVYIILAEYRRLLKMQMDIATISNFSQGSFILLFFCLMC